ncbi:MAG: LPS export ABC transporter periplasmic protein LptC [Rickettsiaceae bacterium]|nr:LPS export ABC transporter periplasmic protein LptC [Rickettsiaceae bacterium]
MQELSKIRFKTKLTKYIFLSASICILVSILVTLYIQKIPTESIESYELTKSKAKKLSKDHNLNISKSVFEGISKDLSPYVIIAQQVAKNTSDKYFLDIIKGKYTLPDGEITIKADSGTLDELKKSVILNNNVKIIFNGVMFNSKQVIVDLDTKDARSDDEVEVIFEKSKIRADQFKTENSSDTIKFKGNVDSNFDLQ